MAFAELKVRRQGCSSETQLQVGPELHPSTWEINKQGPVGPTSTFSLGEEVCPAQTSETQPAAFVQATVGVSDTQTSSSLEGMHTESVSFSELIQIPSQPWRPDVRTDNAYQRFGLHPGQGLPHLTHLLVSLSPWVFAFSKASLPIHAPALPALEMQMSTGVPETLVL